MKMYQFSRTQILPVPLTLAWDFFSDPRNLAAITPPDMGFVITSPVPERTHAGMVVTYAVSPFGGLRVPWVTEITHCAEPSLFVDEQRFGPYRFWHHQHHFREVSGGVEMRDIVHYMLPFGIIGRLFAPVVARRLKAIFDYRRDALAARFAALSPGA
ncbi:MAG TPA: SRPBCC family protein [Geobacter sulfurreducens]|nr:SRPBCC family protein [Geobacter sulfurreducens]